MNMRHQAHKPFNKVNKCHYWAPIFETEWSRVSNCVSMPNFVAIGPAVAEIWQLFRFFKAAILKNRKIAISRSQFD